jgi:antibiotic biosynthesis monooxygenase (ABM) superfamily enzyme
VLNSPPYGVQSKGKEKNMTTPTSGHGAPMPSIHVRAFATWLAIFPLVSIGLVVVAALAPSWDPLFQAFILTLIIVPMAVYFVVPRIIKALVAIIGRFGSSR